MHVPRERHPCAARCHSCARGVRLTPTGLKYCDVML